MSEKKNKKTSVYMKIILNYFQMVSFVKALDVKWPFNTDEYLKSVSVLNSISTSVVDLECLIYQYNLSGEIVHLKAVFSSILPLCLLFIVAFIMIIQLVVC